MWHSVRAIRYLRVLFSSVWEFPKTHTHARNGVTIAGVFEAAWCWAGASIRPGEWTVRKRDDGTIAEKCSFHE